MSYAKGTPNFNLPQTVGTDKRDWSDTNEAFAKLDSAVQSNTDANASAAENITVLQSDNTTNKTNIAKNTQDISAIQNDITDIKGNVGTNAQGITDANTKITDLRQDSEDMICAYNEPTATSAHYYAVGSYFIYNDILYKATQMINVDDTIVPNVNCSATNVTTEILNASGTESGVEGVRNDLEDMICFYKEADNTSDHDYAVDDFFIYDDKLYKATDVINTGSTIAPNTNCTNVSVTNEIVNLKQLIPIVNKYELPSISLNFTADSDHTRYVVSNIFDNRNAKLSNMIIDCMKYTPTSENHLIIGYSDTIPPLYGTTLPTELTIMQNYTLTLTKTSYDVDISNTQGHYLILIGEAISASYLLIQGFITSLS